MKYLLDTNACVTYLNKPDSVVKQRLIGTPRWQICVCSVVKAELFYGEKAVVARMKRSEIRGILDSATLHPGYKLRAASCELSDLLHNEELIGGKRVSLRIASDLPNSS
jgi:hypothetical protein